MDEMTRIIQQINNLKIIEYYPHHKYNVFNIPMPQFFVQSPTGEILEDRLTLPQAREFCIETKDYLRKYNRRKLC